MAESKAQRLAYVQTSEVKIVRRKHRIGITTGTTIATLLSNLRSIPAGATVDDVDCGEDDVTTITFYEEARCE